MFRDKTFSKRLSGLNEVFKYEGKEIKFNAFYLEKMTNRKKLGINNKNAGLYIYRNNRLVGSGLDLGIINKHGDGYLNGFRVELFVDGDCDDIFGSTYMKMIHEKDKNEINQKFKNSCQKALNIYKRMANSEERVGKSNKKVSGEERKEWNGINEGINETTLINKKGGKNNKKEKPTEKKSN